MNSVQLSTMSEYFQFEEYICANKIQYFSDSLHSKMVTHVRLCCMCKKYLTCDCSLWIRDVIPAKLSQSIIRLNFFWPRHSFRTRWRNVLGCKFSDLKWFAFERSSFTFSALWFLLAMTMVPIFICSQSIEQFYWQYVCSLEALHFSFFVNLCIWGDWI